MQPQGGRGSGRGQGPRRPGPAGAPGPAGTRGAVGTTVMAREPGRQDVKPADVRPRRPGPATRAERREGGRHGRPAVRALPAPPETQIRPQLLRLAVLPPVAVALSACAAVLFTVRLVAARTGPRSLIRLLDAAARRAVPYDMRCRVPPDRHSP